MIDLNLKTISVVIPTLGGSCLELTLNSILNSSVKVNEVIIVIPQQYKFDFDIKKFQELNIVIIKTIKGGQVYQRSVGFNSAKGNYILQLDDDIEFDNFLIDNLIISLNTLPLNSAISPLIVNKSNISVYKKSFTSSARFFYFTFYFDFKLEEGKINKFGKSLGIISLNKILKVQWLPGGCVLHHKENLILNDYFPFKSKAFMEDLFHSYYLTKNDIDLFVNSNTSAIIIDPSDEIMADQLFINKINELKIRKYYFSLIGISKYKFYWTCLIDYAITFIKYIYLKTIEK